MLSGFFFLAYQIGAYDRIDQPSKEQCDQAVSHLIKIASSGDTTTANLVDQAKGELALAKEKVIGDYKKQVLKCQSDWNVYKVSCILKSTNESDGKACGKWF